MNNASLHEWVELAKGLAWPLVLIYCISRYAKEIKALLTSPSAALGRMIGAKGFGVEIELAEIAKQTSLQGEREQAQMILPEVPRPDGGK